jgi:hypothetical protein
MVLPSTATAQVLTSIVKVRALGWTRDTTESALHQLTVKADEDEGGVLGQELLRQLLSSPTDVIGMLAFELNTRSTDDTNLWKALLRPKRTEGFEDALTRLRAQHTHHYLVSVLRELLVEVAGGDAVWGDLEGDGHRILEALLVMGTSERFLLERYRLLSPDDPADFAKIRSLVHLHKEEFQTAGGEVWRSLAWARRVSLIIWFTDVELSVDSIVEALLDVDGTSLDLADRAHYVEALGIASRFDDERLAQPIHDLLDQAFSSPQPSDSAWANFVKRALVNLAKHATEDERRLAELHGIRE